MDLKSIPQMDRETLNEGKQDIILYRVTAGITKELMKNARQPKMENLTLEFHCCCYYAVLYSNKFLLYSSNFSGLFSSARYILYLHPLLLP
jgi:hypothetical protein